MADLSITEAGAVQFPMVRHASEMGWTPLSPQDALAMRGGEAGLLFRGEVEGGLRRVNPWMTDNAIRSVGENLLALPPTIEGNRQMLAWLRGERQWYDEAEKRHRQVRLVDFDEPSANVLHVTWEWRLKPPARKGNRADVMFVVNGVPVAIVEYKNPTDADAIERGVTQLRRYQAETPELMGTAQLFNVTHVLDYWYGVTWNLSRRYMARWKETRQESYRFAVQSFFEPTDFLRTLRDWVLFYVEDGETRKTVLRQHQRRAVERIVERCAEPVKRRGLLWHTQGAGKTFTLLTAARLVLEAKAKFRNPTVVVVVDRTELEGQLAGWVERLLGEMQQQDIAVWRAGSKETLRGLLAADRRGLILSMIHKFEGIEKDANARHNIYVFIDEAHRSVARELGTYLMAALPNSTIIELRDHIDTFRRLTRLYAVVRNAYTDRPNFVAARGGVGCNARLGQSYQVGDLRSSHPHCPAEGVRSRRGQGIQPGTRSPSGGRERAGAGVRAAAPQGTRRVCVEGSRRAHDYRTCGIGHA